MATEKKQIKALLRVTIQSFMPHPDNEAYGDMIEADPIEFAIYDDSKGLPQGVIKSCKSILEQMADVARDHIHQNKPPEKEPEPEVKKPSGPPTVELYQNTPGGMRLVGSTPLVDAQGLEL